MFSEDIERDSAIKWVSGRSRNKQINKQTNKQIILLYWTRSENRNFKKKVHGNSFRQGCNNYVNPFSYIWSFLKV